ncbi:MAG TPA: proprotein convertase P-domain-containing protein, partial [Xanthomonadales bacterium]|nr:proprotein convertase P-domain-containing protein [Xanthomonadales bacterium]
YAVGGVSTRQNRVGALQFDTCGQPSFTMSGTNLEQQICTIDEELSNVELSVTGIMAFSNPVDLDFSSLPTGISGNFTPAQVNPDGSSIVDFTIDSGAVTPGLNEIVMRGQADDEPMTGTITREVTLSATIETAVPGAPTLLGPGDAATDVLTSPQLFWTGGAQSGDFTVEIATDPAFSNIVYSANVSATTHQVASALQFLTTYYWRARSDNNCGTGADSTVFSFTTTEEPAEICVSPALAIPDNNASGINSDIVLNLPDQDILDLNISVDLDHTYVGDLKIRLENVESATSVLLYDRHCGAGENMDVTLDDAATELVSICSPGTPVIDGTRKPINTLANFNGLPSSGTWRLNISDLADEDLGTLNEWCIIHTSTVPEPNDFLFEHGFEAD